MKLSHAKYVMKNIRAGCRVSQVSFVTEKKHASQPARPSNMINRRCVAERDRKYNLQF